MSVSNLYEQTQCNYKILPDVRRLENISLEYRKNRLKCYTDIVFQSLLFLSHALDCRKHTGLCSIKLILNLSILLEHPENVHGEVWETYHVILQATRATRSSRPHWDEQNEYSGTGPQFFWPVWLANKASVKSAQSLPVTIAHSSSIGAEFNNSQHGYLRLTIIESKVLNRDARSRYFLLLLYLQTTCLFSSFYHWYLPHGIPKDLCILNICWK